MASGDGERDPRNLEVIQRWFQSLIQDPQGVSPEADVESMILPSSRLDARSRLRVYADAYYARLMECLEGSFPVLRRAVGEETFGEFAFGYLQSYPSSNYSLNPLGSRFADYLEETRPEDTRGGEGPSWPDFLIGLTRLEWTASVVFDGPGAEGEDVDVESVLRAIDPGEWMATRLETVPCLHLLAFDHPVNEYYTKARQAGEEDEIPWPGPGPEYVAVTRRDYVVWRYSLSEPEYRLIRSLQGGATVGESIEAAAEVYPGSDEELATDLHRWFAEGVRADFFSGLK